MSRHLFTSDLHFGHLKVATEHRGFASVGEHDDAVIAALDEHVGPDDVLWVLGDLVGTAREWERALAFLWGVPGRKRLVLGNHDPAHPMNRNAFRHTAALAEVFEWWGTTARTKIDGRDVVLSHFPYTRDRGEPRFVQWRTPNVGAWLLHGHTHGEERVTYAPSGAWFDRDEGKIGIRHVREAEVHVGWDAWRRPVADHEIADLIATEEALR